MKAELRAWVMEIERFAIHDGPGIRTLVFLQGCPLHCLWCANPESQAIGEHLMYYKNKCVKCGDCGSVCKNSAITFENDSPKFHRDKCTHCRQCEKSCLQHAIQFSGKTMNANEIMEVVLRDKDYYENSGGGITISGGEPFVQFDIFLELLKKSKAQGLHTAVETCGQTSIDKIKEAEPFLDLFLFDFKHIDEDKFHKYTGGDIKLILQNLKYIASVNAEKIILRIPVIPGFNNDNDTLYKMFEKACEYGIKNVHLLPYHTLGIEKYEQLGRDYKLTHMTSMKKDELKEYKIMGEKLNLNVQIGG
ncbi:glycyl-radical enzyme activating protein [Clostridium lacusfryxellense]|uniref:glycyl-radical enzyme activating protein n=1 Tax=Clostridium lacusfryxellense TaxID=205328 RepID=UPI001C0C4A2C|nr:glycyl-radical enzyme activating protein [Clostridium lacusfryxellense]MBU3113323.1 glycyl-radical enzyme activating protein [Clostridium lacusfryxellense]